MNACSTAVEALEEPMSISELADREGVAQTAVRHWIEAGDVPAVKHRGQWTVDASKVPERPAMSVVCEDCSEWFDTHKPRCGRMPQYCPECKAERRRASCRRYYARSRQRPGASS